MVQPQPDGATKSPSSPLATVDLTHPTSPPEGPRRSADLGGLVPSAPIGAKRIVILLHESDSHREETGYFVWGLCDAWREMGLDVRVAQGLRDLDNADLVIPHLDLTVTPTSYRTVLERLPNVVNRGVYDISKRRVSTNLLEAEDEWEEPVIVKTDLNYGGIPERRLAASRRKLHTRAWNKLMRLSGLGRIGGRHRGAESGVVDGSEYSIYPSLRDVPAQALSDPGLVVERFLPEREGEMYFARWYIFIGDRYRSLRVGSRNPLVKLATAEQREAGLPVPEEVLQFRRRWGLDFGKIDFVVHGGEPVIFDVTRTPGDRPGPGQIDVCRPYAPGVIPLLNRKDGGNDALEHMDVDREPG